MVDFVTPFRRHGLGNDSIPVQDIPLGNQPLVGLVNEVTALRQGGHRNRGQHRLRAVAVQALA